MNSSKSNLLFDEKIAISLFIDSLLFETEAAESLPETEQIAKTDTVALLGDSLVETNLAIEVKHSSDINTNNKLEAVADVTVAEVDKQPLTQSIIPDWANKPFQVLLFKVAGLKLAVPLIELCGVIEWKDSITEMPGHADFYMGILQHLEYKIAVIDTAIMVLPNNKQAELLQGNPRERVKHIVLIGDYKWGLACDNIGEVITLQPNEVRWRTKNNNRNWLAGTVIEHMCALLNCEGFSAMLEKT
jgi:purine-binding chemotaxis protein CheW